MSKKRAYTLTVLTVLLDLNEVNREKNETVSYPCPVQSTTKKEKCNKPGTHHVASNPMTVRNFILGIPSEWFWWDSRIIPSFLLEQTSTTSWTTGHKSWGHTVNTGVEMEEDHKAGIAKDYREVIWDSPQESAKQQGTEHRECSTEPLQYLEQPHLMHPESHTVLEEGSDGEPALLQTIMMLNNSNGSTDPQKKTTQLSPAWNSKL